MRTIAKISLEELGLRPMRYLMVKRCLSEAKPYIIFIILSVFCIFISILLIVYGREAEFLLMAALCFGFFIYMAINMVDIDNITGTVHEIKHIYYGYMFDHYDMDYCNHTIADYAHDHPDKELRNPHVIIRYYEIVLCVEVLEGDSRSIKYIAQKVGKTWESIDPDMYEYSSMLTDRYFKGL